MNSCVREGQEGHPFLGLSRVTSQNKAFCVLCIVYCVLCNVYCLLYICVLFILHSVFCIVYFVYRKFKNNQSLRIYRERNLSCSSRLKINHTF